MRIHALSVPAAALVVLVALLACKKNDKPKTVLASCDLRGLEGSSTCWDVHDQGFVPSVQSICTKSDPGGTRWKVGAGCQSAGSLGACQSDTATTWYFASEKYTSAADVQKACTGSQKFVPGPGGTPIAPVAPAATATSTVPVGGAKACLYPEGRMCGEFPDSDEGDKKLCDDAKGTWVVACPTANLIGTCKGLSTMKFYKPGYPTIADAKSMCTSPGEKFIPAQ